jgi:hypothetical protein
LSANLFPANQRQSLTGLACVLALLAGCTNAAPPEEERTGVAQGEVVRLVPTLAVVVAGDSVRFTFRVANAGAAAVDLTFGSGQRFDIVVSDGAGSEVWRWSEDRMFTQAVSEERVEAGSALEYEARWDPSGREGVYRAVARLVSSDQPLELDTEFELGGAQAGEKEP